MKHLIIGHGSIGKRHAGNLLQLEEEVILFNRQTENYENKLGEVESVFVTCPTAYHMDFALKAAEKGRHVFIEKPVSNTINNVDRLFEICRQNEKICYVGYNFRFHEDLVKIKENLGRLGKILFVRVEVGEFLPDWHPYEDYRFGYAARADMGGGVVLTLSHEIDYIRWLFGPIVFVKALTGKVSNLKIDVEDIACIIMKSENNAYIELHMDYIQKPAVRTMKIQGEKGALSWDYYENKSFDRNKMFIDEIKHYLECCNGKAVPSVKKEEVLDVMMLIEKIKKDW